MRADTETIGDTGSGPATYTQSAGINFVAFMVLGNGASTQGTYNLSGNANVAFTNPSVESFIGNFGSGTVNQNGGTFSGFDLLLGANAGGSGTYNLQSGQLFATALTVLGPSQVTQMGGTASVSNHILLAGSGTKTSAYSLQGGTLDTPQVQVGGGSTFSQTGGSLSAKTTVLLEGGTITGALTNNGTLQYTRGTFSASLINHGAVAVTSGILAVANGIQSDGTITLPPVTELDANGSGLANNGTVNLTGGILAGSGPVVNSALVTGFGTIGGSGGFTNNSIFNAGPGMVQLTTGFTNSGTITLAAGYSFNVPFLSSGIMNPSTAFLNNSGTINLNGGMLTGNGPINNTGFGTIAGYGAITNTDLTNAGTIVAQGGTLTLPQTFANPGTIQITTGATVAGGAISNSGELRGAGVVTAAINNTGTIEPVGGSLLLKNALTNLSPGVLYATTGNATVASNFATNAGTLNLAGGVFDNAGNPLLNTGNILGYGNLRTGGLTNNGSITFSGGSATLDGNLTNVAGKTVAVTNTPALFTGNVTNAGTIKTTKTTLTILGTYTGQPGGILNSDPADNHLQGPVVLQPGSSILGGSGDRFFVSGGTFTNAGAYNVAGTLQISDPVTNSGNFAQTGTLLAMGSFTNSGTALVGGTQHWGPGTSFNNVNGTATFTSDAGAGGANLTMKISGGTISFAADQHLAGLFVEAGTLDIQNSVVTIHYGTGPDPNAATASAVLAGKSGQSGIFSSMAAANQVVGYQDNTMAQIESFRTTLFGDINLDGKVNNSDFFQFNKSFGRSTGQPGFNPQFDFNSDGRVNNTDYFQFNRNFGMTLPMQVAAEAYATNQSVVPEPAQSGAIAVMALAGLVRQRRR